MFYVLFTYSKGRKERDFRKFRSEQGLIDFLHEKYEEIEIVQIIGVEKSYRLGLIETEELAKSALFEKDLPDPDKDPFPEGKTEEDIDRETKDLPDSRIEPTVMEKIIEETKEKAALKKHPYLRNRPEEKSAMEKVGDDVEKELTEEQILKKNKAASKRADLAIAAAEKNLAKTERFIPKPEEKEPAKRPYVQKEDRKKDWKTCPECNKGKMAPWNTSGRCSKCQQYKKIPKKKTRKIPF